MESSDLKMQTGSQRDTPQRSGGDLSRKAAHDLVPQTIDGMRKEIDGAFQRRQNLDRSKTRVVQRACISIEKERMLAAIEVMQRVLIKKLRQVSFLADHMFPRGDKYSTWTKHAEHFAACTIEITGMMQHGSRKYHVKRVICKWQAFGKLLDHIDRQSRFGGERPDCPGPDKGARIRFERSHRKSFARKRIACNAPSGADVERPARPALQEPRNRLPFTAAVITLRRRDQRIIIISVQNQLSLIWLVSKPDHGRFPGSKAPIFCHQQTLGTPDKQ